MPVMSRQMATELEALQALIALFPRPETDDEAELWAWVVCYDEGQTGHLRVPTIRPPPTPGMERDLAKLAAHASAVLGREVATTETWQRLMSAEQVAARRDRRRVIRERIDRLLPVKGAESGRKKTGK